jgi:type IV pilus assembly protein PilO
MATIDLKQFGEQVSQQFQGLEGRHPGLWPLLPRFALLLVLFVALVATGWGLYWRGLIDELEQGRKQEDALKVQYRDKLRQAVNLDALRKQKEEVTQYVSQLEKQLPSKAEMDALLSDINQAGVGRGARLQLFKPGQVVIRDYYAELPITVRVGGGYHDFGSFASDLANLPRIVTLSNLTIQQDKAGGLTMDATAKTFRYLDAEEIAAHRAAVAAAQAEANKKRGKQ